MELRSFGVRGIPWPAETSQCFRWRLRFSHCAPEGRERGSVATEGVVRMWYVVQVLGGKEEAMCRLIERMVDNKGVLQECFTPRYETQKKVRGSWKTCRNVLFPGYLIAVTDDIERLRAALRGVPEFTRLLTNGETFTPLDDKDKAWICAFTEEGNRTVEMSMGVIEGDRVVVTSGPLRGHEGWIKSVNRRKSLAFLEVEMFGRKLKTKVGLGIVARRPGTSE